MAKTDLVNRLTDVRDIYSFIVELFIYTETERAQIVHKKFTAALQGGMYEDINIIDDLAKNLSLINPFEFSEWVTTWIDKFNNTKLDDITYCYVSLLKIDDVICELASEKSTIIKRGPLNTNNNYLFYYKTTKFYFSDKLQKGSIRPGRQTVEYNVNSINMDFKNFEILNSTKLCDYTPVLTQYKHGFEFTNELKIGFSPLLFLQKWIVVQKDNATNELTIEYNPLTLQEQNNQIKTILLECEKLQVDIVVFPELAMNPETEKEIQNFFIQSAFRHVKLCFLGSVWNNNTNESLLITSQGTILIREQKKVPYKLYDKKEGCYYTEAINSDNKIYLIDLPGFGRIVYLICADYNEDSINAICSIMHANFIFVSSFSNSTDIMLQTANSHAARKAISTILCNSCAATKEEMHTCSNKSFAVIPEVNHKHCLLAKEIYTDLSCSDKSKCEFCVKTFSLKKD